jgi:hypothetical protein
MKTAFAAPVCVALIGMAGCGYSLAGRGVTVDPSIKRIGVPEFRDRSARPNPDLAEKITQRVIEELLRRKFDVVSSSSGVDALVDGEIVDYRVVPVAFGQDAGAGTPNQATRNAVTLVARVSYAKVGVKDPIWANDNFVHREEYDVSENPSTYFDRESQATDRLAQQFARSLVAAMLEAF